MSQTITTLLLARLLSRSPLRGSHTPLGTPQDWALIFYIFIILDERISIHYCTIFPALDTGVYEECVVLFLKSSYFPNILSKFCFEKLREKNHFSTHYTLEEMELLYSELQEYKS